MAWVIIKGKIFEFFPFMKNKKFPFSFLIGFSKMSGCVKMHQITGALKGFTINFCLSHEKLMEKSVYFMQVCMYSVIFFIWGQTDCVSTRNQLLHRISCLFCFVFLEEVLSCLPFCPVSRFPLSSPISVNLSRLVRIILCPLHDCYKLCIQRR